ncbi:CHAP domain-containing protein [Acinetobacter sp. ANC 4648]|uniref:CHAP domain-containing protein n=1 Tax=Acinetobacter sp. ANC 4648 TaxID=1977875 RepID=UPI000A33C75E|nr:CHAP domain-containing protein [Acinetobacter sp. ANC 4648]OTG84018.1 CHAP domain-containing protein [Acinetobacter sp. ANC 4648]
MIYDQHVDVYDNVAPASHIVIRSTASQKHRPEIKSHSGSRNKKVENVGFRSFNFENSDSIDVSKFTQKLAGVSSRRSSAMCAKSIRIALETAGARFVKHPVAAADWGNTLTKIGYRQIQPAFDHPKKGDIYIINRTNRHRFGHIAGFTGLEWVSDFKQRSYNVYKDAEVTYEYYRINL